MFIENSDCAYSNVSGAAERKWSVPCGNPVAEHTEPQHGGARVYGNLTSGLEFTPRFSLSRDDEVLTVGSCFARNVEEALLGHGLKVLTRSGDFPYPHGYLNRYNTPVMLQEIEFAVGDKAFDAHSIVELRGGFADLTSYGAFSSKEEVIEYRTKTTSLFSQLSRAKLAIVTAGLSEVWYDKEFKAFINVAPSEAARLNSERFEFRVLNYNENFAALEKLVLLIRRCAPECKVLLTVSPVPLNATFVARDVIISNTYSKGCLRAVVEELYWKYDFVDYFPSYEMVVLSEPAAVWESDHRHVRADFVGMIMREFVDRYVRG